jgi:hypothetical protein
MRDFLRRHRSRGFMHRNDGPLSGKNLWIFGGAVAFILMLGATFMLMGRSKKSDEPAEPAD